MRLCLEMGVEQRVLEDVLELCREASCCTNLVEQGHGSGAATLQAHAQFGIRSLQVRSGIHQCRALFSKPAGELLVEQLDCAIGRATKKLDGPRYSAKHAFLTYLQIDPDREKPHDMDAKAWSKTCMASHRAKFDALAWEQQMEFQQRPMSST